MGGGPTGGTPATISAGATALDAVAGKVGSTAGAIAGAGGSASGAAGDGRVSGALDRFAAAWAEYARDLETQLRAAATLATSGAEDLATAGGVHPR